MNTYASIGEILAIGSAVVAAIVGLVGLLFFSKSNLQKEIDHIKNEQTKIQFNYLNRFDEIKQLLNRNHLGMLEAVSALEERIEARCDRRHPMP